MAKFTLIEQPAPGDEIPDPATNPQEFRATICSSLSEWWSTVMEGSAAR
jgi:hypothetical protein